MPKDACYHKVVARYGPKTSAYRSGAMAKCRKVGAANWGNKSKKEDGGFEEPEKFKRGGVRKTKAGARLKRWFKEKWRTPRGKKDYSGGENTFRPTRRISKDTPATWSELSASEKARAQREKNTKGRVSRYKRKKKTTKRTRRAEMGGFVLPGPAQI